MIGKTIDVISADNKTLEGLTGQVLDETKNTITIKTPDGEKTLVKNQITISVPGKDNKTKKIDGKQLSGRIEARIKQ